MINQKYPFLTVKLCFSITKIFLQVSLFFFGNCFNRDNEKTFITSLFTDLTPVLKREIYSNIHEHLFWNILKEHSAFDPWLLFTFILVGRVNTSDLIYIFSMSRTLVVIFPFHLSSVVRKSPSLGSVCAGRTAAVCQFSSIRQTSRFLAKSNQVAQFVKGSVDADRGCQAQN